MKRNLGLSLLEVMLVLALTAIGFILGIRLYQTLRSEADARQVQANVEAIFLGMKNYYRINCYGTTNQPGTLNPAVNPPAQKSIDIQKDLINAGLIEQGNIIINSSIVNGAGAGFSGYVAQFNESITPRQICNNPPACTNNTTIGQIVSWQAQVAVQLTNPALASEYAALLQGDCLSDISGGGASPVVTPCQTSGNAGSFVVFERTISNAGKAGTSLFWVTTPAVTQFTQMYRNYTINSTGNPSSQYYLCGD